MTEKAYILAHDLGTTGNKTTLFDVAGQPVAAAFEPYSTRYDRPTWAEQAPEDWWAAVCRASQRLIQEQEIPPQAIAVVSFSGMMNGAVFVDRAGEPLRPAIIWADQRASAEAEQLARILGFETIYRRTGHRPGPAYTAAKVMWVKAHQPEIFARLHQVLQAKDYVAYKLSGVFATDHSDASGTNLFDLERRVWAGDILEAVGLAEAQLPRAYPSKTVIGEVTGPGAVATGLLAGTPVVIGGGDGACATVGAGSVQPGEAYNYIGSSSWIAVTAANPLFDPQMRTFTFIHLDPDLYFPIGTMQSAGGAFDWLERLLRDDDEGVPRHEALNQAASAVPPGARGLLFLPYLIGERSPYWNPLARGAFAGLTMAHGRAEMTRAVMEGVAFNLKLILETLQGQGVAIEAMRLIGGGARSPLWRQILADVYGLPLLLPTLLSEATSLGAALAGGIGVGIFPDYRVAHEIIQVQQAESPNPEAGDRYRAYLDLFRQTYESLEPVHARLAALSGEGSSQD